MGLPTPSFGVEPIELHVTDTSPRQPAVPLQKVAAPTLGVATLSQLLLLTT